MKILLLGREGQSEFHEFAADLHQALPAYDHETELAFVDWIPSETGSRVDKSVSENLRRFAQPYDLVHALGYRTAWACAEAFGSKEAWVYSAYDRPSSTHRFLITRLNESQIGICHSRAVFHDLDESLAIDLKTVLPGIPIATESDRLENAKQKFGFDEEHMVVGLRGAHTVESSFDLVIGLMAEISVKNPQVKLLVSGSGSESTSYQAQVAALGLDHCVRFAPNADRSEFYSALDLYVVPNKKAGFSLEALYSMSAGVPTMLRNQSGLREIVDQDISGFLFSDDTHLAETILEVISLPLTLQTVGHAGKVRVLERFSIDRAAREISECYDLAIQP